jgi:two-component system chemotaxis response regulator CheY
MQKQILLIENGSKPNLEIREWASNLDFQLVLVGNGIEALLWLGKGNIPDLIFAEEEMGLMPGHQFVQYLKASGFFNEIPIIAFGSPDRHEQIASMMQSGAIDYLIRPFLQIDLDKKLNRLLLNKQYA